MTVRRNTPSLQRKLKQSRCFVCLAGPSFLGSGIAVDSLSGMEKNTSTPHLPAFHSIEGHAVTIQNNGRLPYILSHVPCMQVQRLVAELVHFRLFQCTGRLL